jgi:hypothetical protein
VEVDLDIKVAAIEKAIQGKIANEMQRVSLTLDVINEFVSREMTAEQADMSSYFNTNAALFDTRQLPSGDPSFLHAGSVLPVMTKTYMLVSQALQVQIRL